MYKYPRLEHIGEFDEKSMPLRSFFSKFSSSLLVGHLDGPKRRLESIDKQDLYIAFIDHRVELAEEFDE
jgi:hypothetical protein